MPQRGAAFWLWSTGSSTNPGTPHLHFVLTEPCPKGEQLVVNMTGCYPGVAWDEACPLKVGDHQEVTKASYVLYEQARTITPKHYEVWKFGRQIREVEALQAALLDRICQGLLVSSFALPRYKKYLSDWLSANTP